MALIKKPVTGMKDIMPEEMEIRDYAISVIKKTYAEFGFSSIETPCVENIANLTSKQGGDNEKLIFKILKRGEKLRIDTAKSEEDLVDGGLRYDLTVPLVRYYANHANDLPMPFKALQMGNVWRADRPQKGRYRQFMQCDIDIIGEATNLAEIELILATTTTLGRLGFKGFQIRINDRRILAAMAAACGFPADRFGEVFIILDKMDKIGMDGVRSELLASFPEETVDAYLGQFASGTELTPEQEALMEENGSPLRAIMDCVEAAKTADFRIVFDPTLVRGMSYYTGPIFEIAMDEYGGSVGGGGRYDEMIGKFTGQPTPAVGFSIGFERIILLLMERGFTVPGAQEKTAFLVEKNMPKEKLAEIFKEAVALRAEGRTVDVSVMKKNKKFQKQQLTDEGYTEIREYFSR